MKEQERTVTYTHRTSAELCMFQGKIVRSAQHYRRPLTQANSNFQIKSTIRGDGFNSVSYSLLCFRTLAGRFQIDVTLVTGSTPCHAAFCAVWPFSD